MNFSVEERVSSGYVVAFEGMTARFNQWGKLRSWGGESQLCDRIRKIVPPSTLTSAFQVAGQVAQTRVPPLSENGTYGTRWSVSRRRLLEEIAEEMNRVFNELVIT